MTRLVRFPVLTGALAIAFCLATLGPLTLTEARAQVIFAPGHPQAYYNGYGAGYISRYQNGYGRYGVANYGYGAGYNNAYQNGYGRYGTANYGYTVYGNGPYVYGSPGLFGNSMPGVVYGASYGPSNRGLRYGGEMTYPPVYTPSNARYYSPYGYRRY